MKTKGYYDFYQDDEHEAKEALGCPLILPLGDTEFKTGDEIVLKIDYHTLKNSEVTQWFKKEQISGKEFPFMYTQCQAILARSLLPCQDTPSTKVTVSAELTCPSNMIF